MSHHRLIVIIRCRDFWALCSTDKPALTPPRLNLYEPHRPSEEATGPSDLTTPQVCGLDQDRHKRQRA